MREFQSIDEARALLGQEVSVSDWLDVSQERINQFAEATGDHQWIHLDVERAKTESPYGTTIAHGFLTLSLLSCLMQSAVKFNVAAKLALNYGLNRVRFVSAVPAGSRIRARVALQNLEDFAGGYQFTWQITVEIDGTAKPACVAEWLTRMYT
ncbi:MAG: MaoC family dehydratase [Acidobacteria bacterium]|nr:MaoC family dehydratase [Acidobacteriota bacterium]MBI3425703.1 MaoC family dehydratase [Acidobacteriota bacterium]